MQVRVQKFTRTTRPRNSAGCSGSELIHAVARSNEGKCDRDTDQPNRATGCQRIPLSSPDHNSCMAVSVQRVTKQAIGAGRCAVEIYANRAQLIYHGLVKGDPLSQLQLAVGRADPHAVYERMRSLGPVLPTRLGNVSTTSYEVCQQVLRSRSFGVTDPAAPRPGEDMLDLSLLALNPPY